MHRASISPRFPTRCAQGDDYLGIRKFRFIIKCSHCNAEISFKTDPEKGDYECESGASRNFEVWRQAEEVESAVAKKREEEEKVDAMRALENRTIDSKWEMEVLDQLDEIRAMQQRHEKVDHDAVLKKIEQKHSGLAPHGPEQEVDEIEAFREAKSRLLDDDDEDITLPTTKKSSDAKPVKPAPSTAATGAVTFQIVTKKRVAGPSVRQSKKKRKLDPDPVPATEQKAPPPPPPPATASVLGALASYGECSSDEA
jgi:hypothetical protein